MKTNILAVTLSMLLSQSLLAQITNVKIIAECKTKTAQTLQVVETAPKNFALVFTDAGLAYNVFETRQNTKWDKSKAGSDWRLSSEYKSDFPVSTSTVALVFNLSSEDSAYPYTMWLQGKDNSVDDLGNALSRNYAYDYFQKKWGIMMKELGYKTPYPAILCRVVVDPASLQESRSPHDERLKLNKLCFENKPDACFLHQRWNNNSVDLNQNWPTVESAKLPDFL